jgi:uncharacterized protein involved in copper resistance
VGGVARRGVEGLAGEGRGTVSETKRTAAEEPATYEELRDALWQAITKLERISSYMADGGEATCYEAYCQAYTGHLRKVVMRAAISREALSKAESR